MCRILAAALDAVDPFEAVSRSIIFEKSNLTINRRTYHMDDYRRVLVVGAGKAGLPMAKAIVNILGDYSPEGFVLIKAGNSKGNTKNLSEICIIEAEHPIPDQRCIAGSQEIVSLLKSVDEDDFVIFLISGGGSSLLTFPVRGVTLSDLQKLTYTLLKCGADITEINTIRKHLSLVKGGNLARIAAKGTIITLILSDVIGDPLDIIASGPTVPDPSTYSDAVQIIESHKITSEIPPSILNHLNRGVDGMVLETPKPGDILFQTVNNTVIANNLQAARAAVNQAEVEGLKPLMLTTFMQGEARQVGPFITAIARQIDLTGEPVQRPACIIIGGETTVYISGNGIGGRNQEIALSAVDGLAGIPDVVLITLATDGDDGPTDAAGAVVTEHSLNRAKALGLLPVDFLNRNDSYNFFAPLGDLLIPGHTYTNVGDLAFLFAF